MKTDSDAVVTCREMSLIWTSSVLHLPKSLISGVSATAGAVSHSATEDKEEIQLIILKLRKEHFANNISVDFT